MRSEPRGRKTVNASFGRRRSCSGEEHRVILKLEASDLDGSGMAILTDLPVEVFENIVDALRDPFRPPPSELPDFQALLADFDLFSTFMSKFMTEAQLKGRPDIGRLSRTSKRIRQVVEPGLYRDVCLISKNPGPEGGLDPRGVREQAPKQLIGCLLRTLRERTELCRHVKSLECAESSNWASRIIELCPNLVHLVTTRPIVIQKLPTPELLQELEFNDDARAPKGPLESIDWTKFKALRKLRLILRAPDFEESEIRKRTAEAFANLSVQKLCFNAAYNMFDSNPSVPSPFLHLTTLKTSCYAYRNPFDIAHVFLLVGPHTTHLEASDLEHTPNGVIPPGSGPSLIMAHFGDKSETADMSALANLRRLHLTEHEACIPPADKLPPGLRSLSLHSHDGPLAIHENMTPEFEALLNASYVGSRKPISRVLFDPAYQEIEDEESREESQLWKDLVADYDVEVDNFDEEDDMGLRESIRIICGSSSPLFSSCETGTELPLSIR